MFERFYKHVGITPARDVAGKVWQNSVLLSADGYVELATGLAGRSVQDGLYRFHDSSTGPAALKAVRKGFPERAELAVPFGYDWLGRHFALDQTRSDDGELLVVMLEPGTGQALEVPATFASFHDSEIVEYNDAALASGFFSEWSTAHPDAVPLAADQCVGYRVPLFLGGRDDPSNLELSDLDVYWHLMGQLRRATLTPDIETPSS